MILGRYDPFAVVRDETDIWNIPALQVGAKIGRHATDDNRAARVVRANDMPYVWKCICSDEDPVRTFEDALALSALGHNNIVALINVVHNPARGVVHLISEYMDLDSLATVLLGCGDLEIGLETVPPRATAAILMQVLEGLSFANDHGVLHNDLTSSEILMASSGRVAVAEFYPAQPRSSDVYRCFYRPDPNLKLEAVQRSLWAVGVIAYELCFRFWVWNPAMHMPRDPIDATPPTVIPGHIPPKDEGGVCSALWPCFAFDNTITFMDLVSRLDQFIPSMFSAPDLVRRWITSPKEDYF